MAPTFLLNYKFKTGQIVITPNISKLIDSGILTPVKMNILIMRHRIGDWGDVSEDDKKANEDALENGERLLSSYKLFTGEKIWIITEHDRSVTTILTPEEY